MKKFQQIVLATGMAFGLLVTPVAIVASDSTVASAAPKDEAKRGINAVGGRGGATLQSGIKNVINVMLFLIGAVAVIMVIVGGLRYVLSGGDSSATKAAKDTILYAVIGLVVAILAYAIVNFVINAF